MCVYVCTPDLAIMEVNTFVKVNLVVCMYIYIYTSDININTDADTNAHVVCSFIAFSTFTKENVVVYVCMYVCMCIRIQKTYDVHQDCIESNTFCQGDGSRLDGLYMCVLREYVYI